MQQPWTFHSVVGIGAKAAETARGKWRTGICGCFASIGSCCSVCWCTPCTQGQTASIASGGNYLVCLGVTMTLLVLMVLGSALQPVSVAAAIVFMVLGSAAAFVVVFVARRTIRKQEGIPGSDGEDCLLAFCCNWCTTCQLLNQRDEPYRGFWSTYDPLDEEEMTTRIVAQPVAEAPPAKPDKAVVPAESITAV